MGGPSRAPVAPRTGRCSRQSSGGRRELRHIPCACVGSGVHIWMFLRVTPTAPPPSLPPSLPQLRVPPGDLLPSGRSSRLSLGRPCSQPSMSVECAAGPAARFSTKMASEGVGGEQPPPVQTLAAAVPGSLDAVRHDPSRGELSFGVAGNGGAFSADWIRGSAPERAGMGWCRRRGVPPSFACFRSQSSSRRRNAEREDEELVSGG